MEEDDDKGEEESTSDGGGEGSGDGESGDRVAKGSGRKRSASASGAGKSSSRKKSTGRTLGTVEEASTSAGADAAAITDATPSAAGQGARGNSALAMLASAATKGKSGVPQALANAAGLAVPGTSIAAGIATPQAAIQEMWGLLNGSVPVPTATSSLGELQRTASEENLANEIAAAGGDERELKRLRRKQSNRESARRSRLRKQAECEHLAEQVKGLLDENNRLRNEKLQLAQQVEVLRMKLSSVSSYAAAIPKHDFEKVSAELRAQLATVAAIVDQRQKLAAGHGTAAVLKRPEATDTTAVVGLLTSLPEAPAIPSYEATDPETPAQATGNGAETSNDPSGAASGTPV